MSKYRVIKEAIAPEGSRHYGVGEPVDLDDDDPRTAIWLESGVIEKIGGASKAKAQEKDKEKTKEGE